MFTKPGKYIARAKEFLGRQYAQGKLMASRIDGYARHAMDIYKRTTPVLQAISDVSGVGGGHLKQMQNTVYAGAKEYERLRNQIATNSAKAEQAAATIGSTLDNAFSGFY